MSKECPKPRDWSRVKCSRCGEMGHTQVRCKMADPAAEEDDNTNGGNDDAWNQFGNGDLGVGIAGNTAATTTVGGDGGEAW